MRIEILDDKCRVAKSAIIHKENVLVGSCDIGEFVTLLPYNYIENSRVEGNSVVRSSNIVDSTIGENSTVGPFATIREHSHIGKDCRIGNFVEIKDSTIGDGSKVAHLAYIGNATIGVDCNIGCGVIFANYDGSKKQNIIVGDRCFIGSNTILVAPLKIADDTYIAAGSVVTEDTNEGDFLIGRVKPTVKKGRPSRYFIKNPHSNKDK